jgi:tight adherence protein B
MGLIVGLGIGIGILLILNAVTQPMKFEARPLTRFVESRKRMKYYPPEIWPDVVDDLVSAIRAGLSLPQAVSELCQSGPEVLRPALILCRDKYQATGDFVSGLDSMAIELADPQADKFVTSLQVAYEVGGADLGVLLRTLSEVMREELVVRGEIVARQSWTVNGAKLAVAAPWVTALVLSSRDSAASVYTSNGGIRMLVTCAVVSIFAYLVMIKIAKLPQVGRLLA